MGNMHTMDYHIAQVRQLHHDPYKHTWQAWCPCGWFGHAGRTFDAANEDALVHDETENPIGEDDGGE